tara:strand:- start:78 stop:779 length:702 start_codon:yes stop_codon:yes gene_type:complete
MKGLRALLTKEMAAIYYSSVAYVVAAVFTFLMSYTFCAQLFHMRSASLAGTLIQAATLLLLTIPFLTMRQFSEERRTGTLELLLSSPVARFTVVFAKFLSTLSIVTVLLLLVLAFPLTLSFISAPDWGPIVSGLVGLFLFGAALVSIGLAVSAFTSNQLVAAVLSLGIFLLLWMSEALGVFFGAPYDAIAIAFSLDSRFTPFVTGAVYLSDFGFFFTVALFGLLTAVAGLSRR